MNIYPPRRSGKTTLFIKELKRLRNEGKIEGIVFLDELKDKNRKIEESRVFIDEFYDIQNAYYDLLMHRVKNEH